jgi:hypothetical protein
MVPSARQARAGWDLTKSLKRNDDCSVRNKVATGLSPAAPITLAIVES